MISSVAVRDAKGRGIDIAAKLVPFDVVPKHVRSKLTRGRGAYAGGLNEWHFGVRDTSFALEGGDVLATQAIFRSSTEHWVIDLEASIRLTEGIYVALVVKIDRVCGARAFAWVCSSDEQRRLDAWAAQAGVASIERLGATLCELERVCGTGAGMIEAWQIRSNAGSSSGG